MQEASFEAIYRKHSNAVYRFVLYLTRNASDADDVTAETFLRVWISPAPLRTASVRSYLLTIARNLVCESARRRKREDPLEDTPVLPRLDEDLQARRELQAVFDLLATLPELDRAALLLRTEGELEYADIAAMLGISEVAARVRICRVRARLAQARPGVAR